SLSAHIWLFICCFQGEAEFSEISQPVSVQTLKLRESAAIECNMKSTALKTVWYKLTAGRRLHAVATVDNRNNRSVVADEFQKRFSVEFDSISNRLIISATSWDDVGTYFCGEMHRDKVQFGSGTFLFLKGTHVYENSFLINHVVLIITFNLICFPRLEGGQCSAGHTAVMWLKNLHASPADIIYSSGDKTNSCKRAGSGETCVHRLFLKNMDSDDAGMYHCVVTACGHVMLGTGTRIIHSKAATQCMYTVKTDKFSLLKKYMEIHYDLTSQSIFTVDPNAAIFISSVILTICALGVYLGSLVWIIEETNCCFGTRIIFHLYL
uniref:Ig-like domain-containing protein n=1 Tax=Poecilia mexicana TaxID=48701 RepID=A0A3B3Z612_9TELE